MPWCPKRQMIYQTGCIVGFFSIDIGQVNNTRITESKSILFLQNLNLVFCSIIQNIIFGNEKSDRWGSDFMLSGDREKKPLGLSLIFSMDNFSPINLHLLIAGF